jgi:hypothetical protein
MVGEKWAIIEKENQGIISNYAFEGYRTMHKNEHIKERRYNKEQNRSESEEEGRS